MRKFLAGSFGILALYDLCLAIHLAASGEIGAAMGGVVLASFCGGAAAYNWGHI